MVTTYIPKKSFFESTRIQKIAKDIIKDCEEDRKLALEAFHYFKDRVDTGDTDSIAEVSKFLKLSQDANNCKIKVLDSMLKMTQTEIKSEPKAPAKTSFTQLRKKNTE